MAPLRMTASILLLLLLTGCSALFQPDFGAGARGGVSSSLVDYLYPGGQVPPEHTETIPQLNLPLRVGLAFVPGRDHGSSITEATKMRLLDGVKQAFVAYDYIDHIEVIPDTYLRSTKGINGMQQVARLYGVDIMALVSYDQVAVSEDNKAAFLYWTIVGAYIIKGTENEVQTFVDTAVLDVKTAKLLFRAPGVDTSSGSSTAIESGEVRRKQGETSFANAVDAMTKNLAVELARFEERVENNPQVAQVTWKQGSGGGGSLEGLFLLLLIVFAIFGIGRSTDLSDDTKRPTHP